TRFGQTKLVLLGMAETHSTMNIFAVNVWGGIFNRQLLSLQVLPNRLGAKAYLNLLHNVIAELLEDFPIGLVRRMLYQHDGAPPHIGRHVTWLHKSFNGRWISRRGPVLWPARSPDLNPLDFYLRGHMKQCMRWKLNTSNNYCRE
ncbi:hypothetical protein NQ317_017752, partial [Molorchus minor]